jgi:hypothetical protein
MAAGYAGLQRAVLSGQDHDVFGDVKKVVEVTITAVE